MIFDADKSNGSNVRRRRRADADDLVFATREAARIAVEARFHFRHGYALTQRGILSNMYEGARIYWLVPHV